MTMTRHLNVFVPDALLDALAEYAADHDLNRSEAVRLLLHHALGSQSPYVAPALPNWQGEAWTALLHGLFGDGRLVLVGDVEALLAEAVDTLNERDARVLRLRFGLDGPRHTLAEVGATFGVNRERVRQVEAKALRRMQFWLRGSGIWELLGPQLELDKDI